MNQPQSLRIPVRILMVDDNVLAGQALERWFSTRTDLTLIGCAADAESALSRAAAHKPDVVLLDLEIPGTDTLGLIVLLTEACPEARVVIFSGHCRAHDIRRALDAGASGYISKDEQLSVIVSSLLRIAAGELVLSPAAELAFGASE